ncbi:MAG: hypothetical protein ACOH5I_17950 [Oligoflexus sp.]
MSSHMNLQRIFLTLGLMWSIQAPCFADTTMVAAETRDQPQPVSLSLEGSPIEKVELLELVGARKPYLDMKEKIQHRLRLIKQKLKNSGDELGRLHVQIELIQREYRTDSGLMSRLQERMELVMSEQIDLLQQKDELIWQLTEVDQDLYSLTRKIRDLRIDLKLQKRS